MSEDLRDALQRAAIGGEPAVGDAFARFAVVKRRAAIARGATVAVVGLAAAATLFFTLPGLNSGDTGGSLTGGDLSPPPQTRAVKHYVDPEGRFEFDYPAELLLEDHGPGNVEVMDRADPPVSPQQGRPESYDAYFPDDLDEQDKIVTLLQDDVERFYLMIAVEPNAWWKPRDPAPYEAVGVQVSRSNTTIDGRTVDRIDMRFPKLPPLPRPGPDPSGGLTYWCHECTEATIVVRDLRPGSTLRIRVVTANGHLDDYRDELDVIIASLDLR